MTDALKLQIEDLLNINRTPVCEGWCTVEKATVLVNLILENKIKNAVEIGIFGGRSIIPMAMAMKEQGFGEICGIDPWTIDAALEGQNDPANDNWWKSLDIEKIYTGFVEHVLRVGVSKQCRWLRSKSDQAVNFFPDGSIDLFHLDGNHSEQTSCRDVELWCPKLSENSFWVLDDADWPTQQNTVELIKSKGFSVYQDHKQYMVFKR